MTHHTKEGIALLLPPELTIAEVSAMVASLNLTVEVRQLAHPMVLKAVRRPLHDGVRMAPGVVQ